MHNKPWDLFIVVYWDTDMVQHETWRLLDPTHPRHDPAEAAAYRERILDFHRKVDADVGRLLAGIDSRYPGHRPLRSRLWAGTQLFPDQQLARRPGNAALQTRTMDGFQTAPVPAGLHAR